MTLDELLPKLIVTTRAEDVPPIFIQCVRVTFSDSRTVDMPHLRFTELLAQGHDNDIIDAQIVIDTARFKKVVQAVSDSIFREINRHDIFRL